MVITANELSRSVTDRLSGFTRGFIAIDAIVWVMSLLTIAAIFSMIVNERQREIGLLRAMGSSRRFVFRLMLTEAVFLTAAGGLVGIFVGGAALFIFKAVITSSLGHSLPLASDSDLRQTHADNACCWRSSAAPSLHSTRRSAPAGWSPTPPSGRESDEQMDDAMIVLKDLSKTYKVGPSTVRAVESVDLEIPRGQTGLDRRDIPAPARRPCSASWAG